MRLQDALKKWWKSRQRRPLNELLTVEFDERQVRVQTLAPDMDPAWNQAFLWADITRVCFKDEGLWSSDSVFVTLRDREKPAHVPTEAAGGSEFFGAVCDRGLMPEQVWRKAMGDTSGGMHCWPPFEK